MAEIEELIKAGKLQLDEIQKECLIWKGRAMAGVPAMKVALDALRRVEWTHGHFARECPWCGGEAPMHEPGCDREIAIKVIREASGEAIG